MDIRSPTKDDYSNIKPINNTIGEQDLSMEDRSIEAYHNNLKRPKMNMNSFLQNLTRIDSFK